MSKALIAFDYASVDKDTKSKLIALAGEVKQYSKAFKQYGEKIGETLAVAHDLLAGKGCEGLFRPWVECEMDIGLSTAYNLLNVHWRSDKFPILETLPPTVAYLLSPESVPDEAIREMEKAVKKGVRPTVELAKETIAKFREAGKPKPAGRTSAPKKLPSQSDEPPTPAEDETALADDMEAVSGEVTAVKQYGDTFDPPTFSNGKCDLAAKQAPYDDMLNAITSITKHWNAVTGDERDGVYAVDKKNRVNQILKDLRPPIAQARPHALCEHCEGKGCKKCHNCGWWPRSVVEGLKK
jgi:hypothetical protein